MRHDDADTAAPEAAERATTAAVAEPARGGPGLAPTGRRNPAGYALALQRAVGNRATRRILARTPRDDQIRVFRGPTSPQASGARRRCSSTASAEADIRSLTRC